MTQTALIIEDHPLYRGALIELVHPLIGAANTYAVGSAEEGIRRLAGGWRPDLVILDLGLPGLKGIEAIRAYARLCPGVPIIVVSASEDRIEAGSALRAGGSVVVSKAASIDVLSGVLRRVLQGEAVEQAWFTPSGTSSVGSVASLELTLRQQETLVLLAQGYSNKEIALRMGLAEITVKIHVSAVFRLLGVVNRTQAVLAARQLGLLGEEPFSVTGRRDEADAPSC